jgi:hypothetical protein
MNVRVTWTVGARGRNIEDGAVFAYLEFQIFIKLGALSAAEAAQFY